MKKLNLLLLSALLISSISSISSSLALGDIDTNTTNPNNTCLRLNNNLRLRSSDIATSNEVTKLQLFLKNNGFLNINPTGYFGSVTKAAVIAYQLSVQLDGTGYVGSYTRGEIAKDTCDNVSDTPNNTTSIPIGTNNPTSVPIGIGNTTPTVPISSIISPTVAASAAAIASGATTVGTSASSLYGNVAFYGDTVISMMSLHIYNGGEGLKFCLYQPSESPCTNLQPLLQAGGLNFTYSQANGGTYTLQQDVSSKGYPAIPYKLRLVKTNGEEKTLTLNKIGGVITNTILFSSNTTGDGTKVTNMNITIKNGGEGLKYCIETYQSTTYCTNTALLTSSGLNWKYTPEDGGTYTVNQDVSGSNFPFTNYRVYLEKASGERERPTLEVKLATTNAASLGNNPVNATNPTSNSGYQFVQNVDRYWDENRFTFPYPADIDKARLAFIATKRVANNSVDSTQQQYRELLTKTFPTLNIGASGSYSLRSAGVFCLYPWQSSNNPGDCSAPFDKTTTGPKKLRILIPPGVKVTGAIDGAAVVDSRRFVGVHSNPNATYNVNTSSLDDSSLKFPYAVGLKDGLYPIYPFLEGFTASSQSLNLSLQMVNSQDFTSKKAHFVYLTFVSPSTDMNISTFYLNLEIVDRAALQNWLNACTFDDLNKCVEQ